MAAIAAARPVYDAAVRTAETLWEQARSGDHPDPAAALELVDSLAALIAESPASVMALTAQPNNETGRYNFSHLVNVAALTMVQAAALNIDGPLLQSFGIAALMHDIGKVRTPP